MCQLIIIELIAGRHIVFAKYADSELADKLVLIEAHCDAIQTHNRDDTEPLDIRLTCVSVVLKTTASESPCR